MFNIQKINFAKVSGLERGHLLTQSLRETGFAVIENPNISFDLIQELYKMWADFFNTPSRYDYLFDPTIQAGYFPFASESAKTSKNADLKEFFHYYPWYFDSKNGGTGLPKNLQIKTQNLFEELYALGLDLLELIEQNMPEHLTRALSCPLKKMAFESKSTLLRVLHYPAIAPNAIDINIKEQQTRAFEHEDINLITLLPTSTTSGLMVKDAQGNWHEVPYLPNSIVINTGDMLQKCSRGYFKATTHKVIETNGLLSIPRYSMPLFIHPMDHIELTPGLMAGEFLRQRLSALGLLKEEQWKYHQETFNPELRKFGRNKTKDLLLI